VAEIDPRIRKFEEEAAKTLAAMKRSRTRAEAFEAETQRSKAGRSNLDARVRQEVARDRIKGETIGESGGRKSKGTIEQQSRATRNAGKEQERMARLNDQARVSEERLTKQRAAGTKQILSQQEAMRRYGKYAGGRFIERQAERYYANQPLASAAGGGAGRGGYLPPPPPPPTGGGGRGGGFDDGGTRRFTGDLKAERAQLAAMEERLARSTQAHRKLIQVQASGSNVLRRNGALTTEFLQAAARGEVTIRELGYQTAATIGKFGGWITAGAALYTALGAVQKMGRGALDAYSGVNQLQRVINDVDASSARKEFSELADYFQLPFQDVTEGVYEVGKVFHDQNTAMEASKALLYSVKVGELDTATAGRYLISITNAYNLSAQDLNSTFDKFNQLQNNFGVAIAGTEAATARAAGSFVNAGGSLDYLIALIGTAARVTGAAPERIGTALQRAPTFIHKPENEQVLKSFGIDPGGSLDQIFNQAFAVAQRSSGKRRRELAAALFGNQYGAGIGTPLLRQFETFKRIQASIDKSKGSGKRELSRLKESPEEQIKNVGIQLERIGTGLADSGVLSLMATFVLSLDDALRLLNGILAIYNELPGPIKDAVGLMIQLGIAARLLGRLNVGDSIAPPGRAVNPARTFLGTALSGGDKRDARLIRKGLYGERGVLEDERARTADQAREASSRAVLADERALSEQKRLVGLKEAGIRDEKQIARSQAALAQYTQEGNLSREQARSLALDEETKARRLNEVNTQIAKGRGRFGRLNVPGTLSAAEQRGFGGGYYPTTFDQPTTARPTQYQAKMGAVIPGGVPTTPIDLAQLDKQEKQMSRAEKTARATSGRLQKARVGAARLGGAFNGVIGSMGNAIFALAIVGIGVEALSSYLDDFYAAVDDLQNQTFSIPKRRTQYAHGRGIPELSGVSGAISDFIETVSPFGENFLDLGTAPTERVAQEGEFAQRQAKQELEAQRASARLGKPVPFRFAQSIEKDVQDLQQSGKSRKEVRAGLEKYEKELSAAYERGKSGKQAKQRLAAARNAIKNALVTSAKAQGGQLQEALSGLNPAEIQEHLESEITQAGAFGGTTRNRIKRARITYGSLAKRLIGSRDPKDIQALADARSSYFEGLQQTIQDELDHSLALSRSPGESNAAYAEAFNRLRQAYVGGDNAALRAQQQKVQTLQRQFRNQSRTATPGGYDVSGWGGLEIQEGSGKRLKELRQKLGAERKSLKALTADQKQKREFFRQIQQELREQQYEENAAIREAQTSLKISRTADPLAQAKLKLSAVNTEIGKAIEVYGRSSKEVLELLAQRQEILAQQAQDQVNLIDAQGTLRSAGLSGEGNEQAKARSDLQTLEAKLSYETGHASRFDPAEILQLQADVREAQIAFQEQIEQEAEELYGAAIDVRIARAEAGGNDVRAARLNVTKAQYDFKHADTKLEKRQARADLIGKRAGLRDARVSQAIEDVEFEADIGKLTLDQQIAAYQRILNTQKLTRDARRDLRRKIYSLRKETENDSTFDLNVGSIKLPTIYEIRRAVQGGVNGGAVSVSQSNVYQINGAKDPHAVASEINRLNGGANKAALRSAGLR
jgi:TP901 family phage tail tape measure protein